MRLLFILNIFERLVDLELSLEEKLFCLYSGYKGSTCKRTV